MTFLIQIWQVLLELAPWLLLGTAIAGILHVALPEGFVHRQLRGPWAPVKAVALGVPLPLCSCGVIPAGLGLKRDGASDGAAIGFLISTPQTGVDSILVSASMLGWPFALFKVASAALTGIVGGVLADRFGGGESQVDTKAVASSEEHGSRGLGAAVSHADEVLRSIWGWLAFGVLVSAAISTWVPTSVISSLGVLGSFGAALAMLVISLPLYVCATASVPIAAALVAGGMPPGAALVLLMAGPASNVATIGAIHRTFGKKVLAVYLGTLIVGSVGLAVAFDFVLAAPTTATVAHHGGASLWAVASAVFLIALMAAYAWADLRRWLPKASAPAGAQRTEIAVEGMSCNGCVRSLESALLETPGVTTAEVSLKPGLAVVTGTVDRVELFELIREKGYQPS